MKLRRAANNINYLARQPKTQAQDNDVTEDPAKNTLSVHLGMRRQDRKSAFMTLFFRINGIIDEPVPVCLFVRFVYRRYLQARVIVGIRLPYNHRVFLEIPPGFSGTIIPDRGTDILDVRPILFHFLSKNGARKHHEGRDGGMKYEPGVRTLESI